MPNIGLMSPEGDVRKTWAEVDASLLSGDIEWAQPASPALVAALLDFSTERADVRGDEVSASQFDKGIRALFLEATRPFYVVPDDQIASILGTIKHALINKERPGFITETRLFAPHGSAKCDTLYTVNGLLEDLKNIGWYSVKLMLERGALQEKPGYAYQVNLFRVLLKDPKNQEILYNKYSWLKPEHLNVKRMQLTCCPPDVKGPAKKEAKKLLDRFKVIPITVPFIDDDQVLKAYEKKHYELGQAIQDDYAEICSPEERWETQWGYPTKCIDYCPVNDHCLELSEKHGEEHPITAWKNKQLKRAFSPQTAMSYLHRDTQA